MSGTEVVTHDDDGRELAEPHFRGIEDPLDIIARESKKQTKLLREILEAVRPRPFSGPK